MLLSEINPHIRYAKQWHFRAMNGFSCAVDYHFYFITKGTCDIAFGGNVYHLKENSLIFLPPGVPYHFFHVQNVECIDFNFDFTQQSAHLVDSVYPVLAQDFDDKKIIEKVTFSDAPFFNNGFHLEDILFINKEMNEIIREFRYKKRFYLEISAAVLKKIFTKLARYFTVSIGQSKVDLVLEYIHSHFNEPLDNAKLAAFSGYHPVYLNQQIKQITGVSLKQYIINYRLEQAQQMLAHTNNSIAEIAAACGYDSTFYFSGAFREKMGMSPTQYRKSVLKYGAIQ